MKSVGIDEEGAKIGERAARQAEAGEAEGDAVGIRGGNSFSVEARGAIGVGDEDGSDVRERSAGIVESELALLNEDGAAERISDRILKGEAAGAALDETLRAGEGDLRGEDAGGVGDRDRGLCGGSVESEWASAIAAEIQARAAPA